MKSYLTSFRCGNAAVCSAVGPLTEQRRHVTRLYTSYFSGRLFPNQLVRPKARLPAGVVASLARTGARHDAQNVAAANASARTEAEPVSWEDVSATDLVHTNAQGRQVSAECALPPRPYVPLAEVAKVELQGDYLTEGGAHQEALEHYGVVAKAYDIAYPENHTQRIGIRLKLTGAFRRTGRLESAKANAETALQMLDSAPRAPLELIVEALLELGLTLEASHDASAGGVYEEAIAVINGYHDFGASHQMVRLLPRLSRRFNLNYEEKFLYYSPFDYDRVFALGDQCLARAEAVYRGANDSESVIRVLQTRKELMDKKFFNMRDFAGRIHTMRGHWMRQSRHLTNAPTPEDVLRYSPTIHQVYRDFRFELNAPLGREKEVHPGVNRTVMDMGSPYRRRGGESRRMMREADYKFNKYVQNREFKE